VTARIVLPRWKSRVRIPSPAPLRDESEPAWRRVHGGHGQRIVARRTRVATWYARQFGRLVQFGSERSPAWPPHVTPRSSSTRSACFPQTLWLRSSRRGRRRNRSPRTRVRGPGTSVGLGAARESAACLAAPTRARRARAVSPKPSRCSGGGDIGAGLRSRSPARASSQRSEFPVHVGGCIGANEVLATMRACVHWNAPHAMGRSIDLIGLVDLAQGNTRTSARRTPAKRGLTLRKSALPRRRGRTTPPPRTCGARLSCRRRCLHG
jgi:hypothetical protein